MAYKQEVGRGAIYCAIVVQWYCTRVGNAGGRGGANDGWFVHKRLEVNEYLVNAKGEPGLSRTTTVFSSWVRAKPLPWLQSVPQVRTLPPRISWRYAASWSAWGWTPKQPEVRSLFTTRSWLQHTLKRKLVDFAWNRRFFYLPGACSPFFG